MKETESGMVTVTIAVQRRKASLSIDDNVSGIDTNMSTSIRCKQAAGMTLVYDYGEDYPSHELVHKHILFGSHYSHAKLLS